MNNKEVIPLLSEMAIFVAVAEEQSFSEASRRLAMAASSVTRSVRRLEEQLQVRLLERTTRRVRLSSAGVEVYAQCKQMLESAHSAVQAAQSTLDEASGSLTIAAPKAFAKQILAPVVLDFLEAYPGVSIKFKVADHFIDPISDEVDVIFRLTNQPIEGLVSKTLNHSDLVICASPAYLAKAGVPAHPDDLLHHQCINLGEKPDDNEWLLTNANQRVLIKTNPRFSVNHTEIRKAAALRDMGVTIFPSFTVKHELETGTLIELLPDWHISGNYQGQVILQYSQSRYIPIQIRVFVNYMVERFSFMKLGLAS